MARTQQMRSASSLHSPRSSDLLADPFALGTDDARMATVMQGLFAEQLPIAELTVGEVRRRYRDRFNIDPDHSAFLDGQQVGDDAAVRAGQMLEFADRVSEKGR